MMMSPNKAETALHGCLIPARWYGCAHAYGEGHTMELMQRVSAITFNLFPILMTPLPRVSDAMENRK